jgi:hypothetical protein
MDLESDLLMLRCGLVTADEFRARMHSVVHSWVTYMEDDRLVNCGDFTLRIVPDWGQS